MSAAWAPALDDDRGGEQRDHRLAGADIALEQAEHALGPGEVGLDLGERRAPGCRSGVKGRAAISFLRMPPSPCRARPALRR